MYVSYTAIKESGECILLMWKARISLSGLFYWTNYVFRVTLDKLLNARYPSFSLHVTEHLLLDFCEFCVDWCYKY